MASCNVFVSIFSGRLASGRNPSLSVFATGVEDDKVSAFAIIDRGGRSIEVEATIVTRVNQTYDPTYTSVVGLSPETETPTAMNIIVSSIITNGGKLVQFTRADGVAVYIGNAKQWSVRYADPHLDIPGTQLVLIGLGHGLSQGFKDDQMTATKLLPAHADPFS